MKILKIKCNNCKGLENYQSVDLVVSQTPDDVEVTLHCKKCGCPDVGGQKDLESLLENYPEQEPDEDWEWNRFKEDKNEIGK